MAEPVSGDVPPTKRVKNVLCRDIFPPEKKSLLDKALQALEDDIIFSFTLLKVTYSNAEKCVPFSESILEVERSADQQHPYEATKVHSFTGVFAKGVKILKLYLEDPEKVPEDKETRIALERLKETILKIEDIGQSLAKVTKKREEAWRIGLIHHLLKELSVNQQYTVDIKSEFIWELCPCCNERLQYFGKYDDCSLGHGAVWHGSADILLGPQLCPNIAVYAQDPEVTRSTDGSLSSFVEDTRDLIDDRSQIIAETIVSAFLQKKNNPAFENYLIPMVAFSKKDVLFHFYDPEHDILLESPSFDIFSYDSQLYYPTVLALWFTLNYQTFCTGITRGMKEQNFTADFLSRKSNDIKAIYQDGLHFRDCRTGFFRSTTYYKPTAYAGWVLDKTEPYMAGCDL